MFKYEGSFRIQSRLDNSRGREISAKSFVRQKSQILDDFQTHVVDAWPFSTHKCVHFWRSFYRSVNGEVLRQLKVNLWNKPEIWIVLKGKAIIIIFLKPRGKAVWELEKLITRVDCPETTMMDDGMKWNEARKVSSLHEIWRVFFLLFSFHFVDFWKFSKVHQRWLQNKQTLLNKMITRGETFSLRSFNETMLRRDANPTSTSTNIWRYIYLEKWKIFHPIFIEELHRSCQVGSIVQSQKQNLELQSGKVVRWEIENACLNIDYENYTNE